MLQSPQGWSVRGVRELYTESSAVHCCTKSLQGGFKYMGPLLFTSVAAGLSLCKGGIQVQCYLVLHESLWRRVGSSTRRALACFPTTCRALPPDLCAARAQHTLENSIAQSRLAKHRTIALTKASHNCAQHSTPWRIALHNRA